MLENNFKEGEGGRFTMSQLADLFKSLIAHYEILGSAEAEKQGFNMNGDLPLSISQLDSIHKQLAEIDGVEGSPFEQKNGSDAAKIVDLTHVLDMLINHFVEGEPTASSDLEVDVSVDLAMIFGKMADYYQIEDQLGYHRYSMDLWFIYGSLEDIFYESAYQN